MAIKLSGPRAFRLVVTVVAVVIAPFFVAIIIATWSDGRGGRSSDEPLGTWSTWSMLDVVGARRSCSRRGRRGPWSTWSELGGAARDVIDVVGVRSVRWSEGMYLVPSHGEAKALGHVQPRSAYSENPRMVVGFNW